MMAIAILFGDEAFVIPRFKDLRTEIDPRESQVRAYFIPENAERKVMIVQVYSLRLEDAPAALDGQIVQQVEGLQLFTEAEDEMSDARNATHDQVWWFGL
jgi:hypothetical protein